ncbi:unnamed protein product [Hermetia illucens]|uniref:Uncharacterized protein n=1 Tax=Hermetia illucens TaxID=343691 RepID=A0A7R8US56_HERIL|nr:uncharacterized protein LOC119653257 isoform X2 [Hermetia illucens]CAD7085961.1 unnamed protein product [Hermetia illucens]
MCEGSVIVVNCPVPDPSTTYKQVLHLVDILLSSFVIGPLVIAAWRGIWNLADIYLFPDDGIDSALASIVIGLVGYMLFMLPQKLICDSFNRDKHRITFYIFSRLYTFIFAVISVLGCRGPWNLVDLLTPYELTWINLLTVAAVVLLIVTKSLANVNAAPFLITTDEHEDYFLINTRFKTSATEEPVIYILDCLFSTLVIGSLVAVAWRGIWAVCDILLYPDDGAYSAWASTIIGYTLTALTFAIQPITRSLCDQIDGYRRIAVADAFLFFSFIGCVNVWRGIWMLLDVYFIPDDYTLSNWVSYCLSFLLLVLLNCSNSILVRGVFIDAEEPSGKCVVFPIYYIRLVFQKQRIVLEKNQEDCTTNVIHINTGISDEKLEKSKGFATQNCMGEDAVLINEYRIVFD